jgi:hypothetical protein
MSSGGSIPVWFSDDDRQRVEEGAALAGYRHLSKYIRDRTLGRRDEAARDPLQAWVEREDLVARLSAAHQESQVKTQALLAALLMLVVSRSTTKERGDLIAACQGAATPAEILAGASPELARQLIRLLEGA